MTYAPDNLVFEGGGVLGIAYLGALHYLWQSGGLRNLKRTAGTSAGAITACMTSLNLPFPELKSIIDTLNFKNIPDSHSPSNLPELSAPLLKELESVFDDFNGFYRIVTKYGWFSSNYFYQWLKTQIASQFDPAKKEPPIPLPTLKIHLYIKGKEIFMICILSEQI